MQLSLYACPKGAAAARLFAWKRKFPRGGYGTIRYRIRGNNISIYQSSDTTLQSVVNELRPPVQQALPGVRERCKDPLLTPP
jgi:hypothetical protein